MQPASLTPAANLPPVLLALVAKFAAGVVDNGSNLPTVSLTPVSLTLVVHLDLQISLQIFEKIRNDPNVIIRGLGEGNS